MYVGGALGRRLRASVEARAAFRAALGRSFQPSSATIYHAKRGQARICPTATRAEPWTARHVMHGRKTVHDARILHGERIEASEPESLLFDRLPLTWAKLFISRSALTLAKDHLFFAGMRGLTTY
jgi:hypothetical protein